MMNFLVWILMVSGDKLGNFILKLNIGLKKNSLIRCSLKYAMVDSLENFIIRLNLSSFLIHGTRFPL